jgi:alkylation response protein AidB-like acyl-CoA dehydrogenase
MLNLQAQRPSAPPDPTRLQDDLSWFGAGYDAQPAFPARSLKALADRNLHRRFAPIRAGGERFADERSQNLALMDVLRTVGRGDLSVGRLFEGHVNALKLFDWYGSDRQIERLRGELEAGRFYGVWATEPAPGVLLTQDVGRLRLSGKKAFASGAGGLDFALITARSATADRRLVIVAANDPARADLSGWRVRGMRASQSGTYDLSGVEPCSDDLLGEPGVYDREPRFTSGAWRFTAVQLGGIEALLIELRAMMNEAKTSDPLQRAKFAEAVVASRTAFLWVREAAVRAGEGDPDAIAFSQMTRGVVERAALDVMELVARIIGTRSAFDDQRIDKIIRDLSLYLRQAGPDHARDVAAVAWLDHDVWGGDERLW